MLNKFNKVNYVSRKTIIGAENLNNIQDSVLDNTEKVKNLNTDIENINYQLEQNTNRVESIENRIENELGDLDKYVTESELESKGYLTQHQDLSGYAKKSELHSHLNKNILDNITNEKIIEWNNKSTFDGNYNSLTNKPSIPTKVSELTNDNGYITTIPSEYITESELNAIISQINALRSDVDRLLQNNGGAGESEKLYYNPTITIENNRAVFREDGYEERFLITHVENRNDPNYRGSVQVRGSDGYDYYVLLTDNAESTNSKFRYNNLIPSHGGWMSLENKANQPYQFDPNRTYPYRNNFNFTDTVENVDGSVNPEVLNLALEHLNTSFPAVNMQVATSSKNKIRQQSVQDPWWGAHYGYAEYFDIIINERPIENWVGPYGAGYFDYSDRGGWIHTVLHELGHTFGLKDQPKHDPSLFNYDASYEQLAGELFLQPNDLCALSYFYKQHYNLDITPETTQEDINNQLAQNAQVATFTNELDTHEVEDDEIFMDFMYPSFDTTDMKVEVSDVVVRCKLKFDKEEKIQITKDESNNLSLKYNVFTIEPLETFKGELVNNKLKIHISENINIDENAEYLAYLVNFEDVPCSLINPKQGLEKLS